MFNFIVSALVVGVISASGAQYLLSVEQRTQQVAAYYSQQTSERFKYYDKVFPGIVKWPGKQSSYGLALQSPVIANTSFK